MVTRPASFNAFEFTVVCALRAKQLISGSTPRVDGHHRATVTAQMEVATGHVARAPQDVKGQRQWEWQR